MKYKIGYDEKTLREVALNPEVLREYLQELEIELAQTTDLKRKVSILGEQGLRFRTLNDLVPAEAKLREALALVETHQLGIQREIQQKLRLAHVLQWKKEFNASDALFAECLQVCLTNPDVKQYLAFSYQHAGKNFFDQDRFQEANDYFEKALELRLREHAPPDQIESSEQALTETRRRLEKM